MKIYIASSFSLIPKVTEVCKVLEANGHTITVKWWTRLRLKLEFAKLSPEDFYSHPECSFAYETDVQGVKDADVLLFIADDQPRAYNGANVELGIALALNKICLSLGRLQNSALYYKVIKCDNIDEVLFFLKKAPTQEDIRKFLANLK